MNRIIERLSSFGVVPVVALDHSCTAASVAKALIAGGLPCAEITFRTAAAEESIHLIKAAYPDMLIGAGTVTTTGQVDQAINAGAEFIVSPGIDRKLIDYCVKKQIAVIPGCAGDHDRRCVRRKAFHCVVEVPRPVDVVLRGIVRGDVAAEHNAVLRHLTPPARHGNVACEVVIEEDGASLVLDRKKDDSVAVDGGIPVVILR